MIRLIWHISSQRNGAIYAGRYSMPSAVFTSPVYKMICWPVFGNLLWNFFREETESDDDDFTSMGQIFLLALISPNSARAK